MPEEILCRNGSGTSYGYNNTWSGVLRETFSYLMGASLALVTYLRLLPGNPNTERYSQKDTILRYMNINFLLRRRMIKDEPKGIYVFIKKKDVNCLMCVFNFK